MYIWITRDKNHNEQNIDIWLSKPFYRKGKIFNPNRDTIRYIPNSDKIKTVKDLESYNPKEMNIKLFTFIFGFTPEKGSCQSYSLVNKTDKSKTIASLIALE